DDLVTGVQTCALPICCWLEYVVEIARFKASGTGSILPAFKLLTNQTSLPTGKPTLFDLYRVYPLIAETLRLGLKHIADGEWPARSEERRVGNEIGDR